LFGVGTDGSLRGRQIGIFSIYHGYEPFIPYQNSSSLRFVPSYDVSWKNYGGNLSTLELQTGNNRHGQLEVFAVSKGNNSVMVKGEETVEENFVSDSYFVDGWSDWQNLGENVHDFSVIKDHAGDLVLFAITDETNELDRRLIFRDQNVDSDGNIYWRNWRELARPGIVKSQVKAIKNKEDGTDVFALGIDYSLLQRTYTPGQGWSSWIRHNVELHPFASYAVGLNSDKNLELFVAPNCHASYTNLLNRTRSW
jgi:hypothetical protein